MFKWITEPITHGILAVVIVLGAVGYAVQWHKKEVEIATVAADYAATKRVEDKHAKDLYAVEAAYSQKMYHMKKELQYEKETRRIAVADADAKLDAARKWLYSLPEKGTGSTNNTSNNVGTNTGFRPDSPDIVIGQLYRSDAIALAEYSRKTEELKLALIEARNSYQIVRTKYDQLQMACTAPTTK